MELSKELNNSYNLPYIYIDPLMQNNSGNCIQAKEKTGSFEGFAQFILSSLHVIDPRAVYNVSKFLHPLRNTGTLVGLI